MTSSLRRRTFLKQIGLAGVALAARPAFAAMPSVPFRDRIGIQLSTVRDRIENGIEPIFAELARIGYREIESFNGFSEMSGKALRTLLDRYGLSCPLLGVTLGRDLDPQWARLQEIGARYTLEPLAPFPKQTGLAVGQYKSRNAFLEVEAFGPDQPPLKIDDVKRRAAAINAYGRSSSKFGIKISVHNHTGEFEPLLDSPKTEYEVLMEETDPAYVTMELDIGWALIAGIDPLDLFRRYPGRFELWHVKDEVGLKTVNPALSPNQRVSSMAFTPVGRGQVDWRRYFDQAELAGMKHFFIEQDNAASWGDSMAAARESFRGLSKILA